MKAELTQPVAELPVKSVEKAQKYYRDVLGFTIEWLIPGKNLGAVSYEGGCAIFLRERLEPFEPAVHWIFAPDVDSVYEQFVQSGAIIVDDIENKPWGIRQFEIEDLDGNVFYIHHDLPKDEP